MTAASRVLTDLVEDGYALLPLLQPATVAAAAAVLDDLDLRDDHEFFVSVAHAWGDAAVDLDRRLRALVADDVARAFPDHDIFLVAATSKGSHRGAEVQSW